MIENRSYELRDVPRVVLVVRIRVDNDVSIFLECPLDSGDERLGEAAIVGEVYDVINAVTTCHLDGAVSTAVVNNKPLNLAEA